MSQTLVDSIGATVIPAGSGWRRPNPGPRLPWSARSTWFHHGVERCRARGYCGEGEGHCTLPPGL